MFIRANPCPLFFRFSTLARALSLCYNPPPGLRIVRLCAASTPKTHTGTSLVLSGHMTRIAAGNEVSVRLHEAAGFEHIGVMREVGRKFGQLLDIHLMQKIYRES